MINYTGSVGEGKIMVQQEVIAVCACRWQSFRIMPGPLIFFFLDGLSPSFSIVHPSTVWK